MSAEDRPKVTGRGFSGLSELVSDVGATEVLSSTHSDAAERPGAVAVALPPAEKDSRSVSDLQPSVGSGGSSSDVTTGKWMVGIGLGIGVLVLVLVNSGKHEHQGSPSIPAPVPTSPVTPYPPPASPQAPRTPAAEAAIRQRLASAESVEALGQRITFSNPRGYCTPGGSPREVALVDLAKRSLGDGARLLHAAVLCAELEGFKAGRRETLDHWLQVQLIGPKGHFKRIDMPRESFLAGISDSTPRVDAAQINQRLRNSLKNNDVNLSGMQVEAIGRDGNAVYFAMRMSMSSGGADRQITGLSAITLLNALPLSVNVYEGTGLSASRDQLQPVQQELLNSLLTEN